jgi:hypothetical protein
VNFRAGSHCAVLADILADGEWHSSWEILREAIARQGEGMIVHSRISDLRKSHGFIIASDKLPGRGGRAYRYRLLHSPSPDQAGGVGHPAVSGSARRPSSPSEPERRPWSESSEEAARQRSLFEAAPSRDVDAA